MSEWISTAERMPDNDGFYVVYMRGYIWGCVKFCGFYDGKWDEDDATISHWMPLPEPPEVEE